MMFVSLEFILNFSNNVFFFASDIIRITLGADVRVNARNFESYSNSGNIG